MTVVPTLVPSLLASMRWSATRTTGFARTRCQPGGQRRSRPPHQRTPLRRTQATRGNAAASPSRTRCCPQCTYRYILLSPACNSLSACRSHRVTLLEFDLRSHPTITPRGSGGRWQRRGWILRPIPSEVPVVRPAIVAVGSRTCTD